MTTKATKYVARILLASICNNLANKAMLRISKIIYESEFDISIHL